ncbi:unnamed protein product, partial [Ectocarpus sp. 13 AM-2016]
KTPLRNTLPGRSVLWQGRWRTSRRLGQADGKLPCAQGIPGSDGKPGRSAVHQQGVGGALGRRSRRLHDRQFLLGGGHTRGSSEICGQRPFQEGKNCFYNQLGALRVGCRGQAAFRQL